MNDQEACHAICQEHKKLKVDLNEMLTGSSFPQQETTTLGSLYDFFLIFLKISVDFVCFLCNCIVCCIHAYIYISFEENKSSVTLHRVLRQHCCHIIKKSRYIESKRKKSGPKYIVSFTSLTVNFHIHACKNTVF